MTDQGDVRAAVNQGVGLNVSIFAVEHNWYDTKPDLVTAGCTDAHSVTLALLCLAVTIRLFVVFVEELVMPSSAFLTTSFALTCPVFVAEALEAQTVFFDNFHAVFDALLDEVATLYQLVGIGVAIRTVFLRGSPPSVIVLGRCLSVAWFG